MQKWRRITRKLDHSFLNNGFLPAKLVKLTSGIASLKTMAGMRKEEFQQRRLVSRLPYETVLHRFPRSRYASFFLMSVPPLWRLYWATWSRPAPSQELEKDGQHDILERKFTMEAVHRYDNRICSQ